MARTSRVGASRRLAAVVPVLALLAVACSAERAEVAVLNVILTDDWASARPVIDAVLEFERENPGVRVDITDPIIENIPDAVRARIAAGSPPDVVQWHAFAAAAQGIAEPIDDLWARSLRNDQFLPGALDDVMWQGVHYGIPLDTNAMLIVFDVERFAASGMPSDHGPVTFDAFTNVAKRVTRGGRRAIGIPSSTWHTYGWIRAFDGELMQFLGEGRPHFTFDSPGVVRALEYLAGLVASGRAFPPVGRLGDRIDAFALLRAREAAMHATGSWDVATLEKDGVGGSYRVALMPRPGEDDESRTVMGGSSLFIGKGSARRDLAFKFMLHLTSDRFALRLAKEEGRLPARPQLYRDPYFQTPTLRTFTQQLRTAKPFMLEAFPAEHTIFREAIVEILQGGAPVERTLKEAQRLVEKVR